MPPALWVAIALIPLASLLRFTPTTVIAPPTPAHPSWVAGRLSVTSRVDLFARQYSDPWIGLAFLRPEAARWRIAIPALAHWLHLPLGLYFLLPRMGGIALILASALILWRETSSVAATLAGTLLVATTSAFFVAIDWIQFDPFYVLLLLGFVFLRNPVAAFACCALGPWIDERFLLILPAVACLRLSRRAPTVVPAALGVAPYVAVRLAALLLGDRSVSQQLATQHLFNAYFPVGWWEGFRAGWIPVLVGLVAAPLAVARARGRTLAVAYSLGTVAGLAAIVWLAYDTSRSIAVLLPFLLEGVSILSRRRLPAAVGLLAGLNLLLPAGHVIARTYYPLRPIWRPPDFSAQSLDGKPGPWPPPPSRASGPKPGVQ